MGLIGRIVDRRYEIIEEIGRGGFAIVYRARDLRLSDAPVTIKYLRPEQAENANVLSMFKAEVQLSSRLRHNNVQQIRDQLQEGDDHFIILEYVEGADFRKVIMRAREKPQQRLAWEYGQRLPDELTAFIVREVCNALEYAHNLEDTSRGLPLNIVHRDISPQNILISYGGDVKLTDFGIAKALDSTEHTQTGVVKGKYSYMSPEQIAGQPVDRTSDLYSLGIVFYEAVAGEKLYSANSDLELQRRVVKGGIEKERLESSAIPVPLRRVLSKALQPDRNRRYQRGAEMALELSEYLSGKHNLGQDLAEYMDVMFRAERRETDARIANTVVTRAVVSEHGPAKMAVTTTATAASGPAVAESGAPPAEGERTIIDIVKIAAYSGRRFFAIGGAVLLGVLIVLLAADTFVTRATRAGRGLYFAFFPPSAILTTVPDRAQVIIDGKKYPELTPARLAGLIPRRPYIARLKHDGFEPLTEQITVSEPRGQGAAPETLSYSFHIPVYVTSRPPGARVLWDGNDRGTTPASFPYNVRAGFVLLRLSLPGFDTLSYQIDMLNGSAAQQDTFLKTSLKQESVGGASRATLVIDGSFCAPVRFQVDPTDANVMLDGEPLLLTSNGSAVKLVKCGSHTGRATLAGFADDPFNFEVATGDTKRVQVLLTRSVRITARDAETGEPIPNAVVSLGGERRLSGSLFPLSSGSHTADVSADGYQTQKQPITVSQNSKPSIDVKLARGRRTIHIRVTHNGAPVPRATVAAVADDGSETTVGETDESGEVATNTDELSGHCRFKVYAQETTFLTPQSYEISWLQSEVKIEYR